MASFRKTSVQPQPWLVLGTTPRRTDEKDNSTIRKHYGERKAKAARNVGQFAMMIGAVKISFVKSNHFFYRTTHD
ncbi:MAG TPA: hypothetical protein VIF60_21705 [Burkholderiaceae bacterium]|jgi:hypothetical protein